MLVIYLVYISAKFAIWPNFLNLLNCKKFLKFQIIAKITKNCPNWSESNKLQKFVKLPEFPNISYICTQFKKILAVTDWTEFQSCLKLKSPEKNSTQVCRIMVVLEFVNFSTIPHLVANMVLCVTLSEVLVLF